jgi:hypothetical protein
VNLTEPFALGHVINGSMIHSDQLFTITGYVFDVVTFLTEARIYGAITGFSILFTYIGWRSILRNFRFDRTVGSLSLHSFVWHFGFEFAHGIFVCGHQELSPVVDSLFCFLFLSQIFIYFTCETQVIVMIWRTVVMETRNPITYDAVLFEIAVALVLASICLSLLFVHPCVILFFFYSFFIPQIMRNFLNPYHRNNDHTFCVCVTIARLVPLFYFGFHSGNIRAKNSPLLTVLVTVYVLVQLAIVLLQDAFGSAFFLPRSSLSVPYNYFQIPPQESDCPICISRIDDSQEAMVTPCSHAFHRTCLERWMEERLDCPLCRAPLPSVVAV